MTRKIIALLVSLLLMLPSLPVLAEAAATTDAASGIPLQPFEPSRKDFLGEWTLLYVISDGAISPDTAQHAPDTIIIGTDGMYICFGEGQVSLVPYEITGNTITHSSTVCILAAPDLLLAENEGLGTLVYQRTAQPVNPFIGDWRLILTTVGGVQDCTWLEESPVLRFSDEEVSFMISGTESSIPCVYRDGVCIAGPESESVSFSIDTNGLMRMYAEPFGTLALLLREQ